MRAARRTIIKLDYRRSSGLFRRDGEYIADIQPDAGGRIIRKLGSDQGRARKLFWDVVDEAENGGENPRFADFLTRSFLPSQEPLKSYAYSEKCVGWLLRFLSAEGPDLRLRDVNRSHVERLRLFYAHLAPQTRNHMTQKLKQALSYAVDTGFLDANPVARVKQLPVDNRRTQFLSMDDVVRILEAACNTDAHDLFLVISLTGLRPSNVRLLTADEAQDNMLRIPPAKMKNSRWGEIPISAAAREVLAENTPRPLYFPARGATDRPKSIDNLSRSYRSIVRRLPVSTPVE